MVSVTIYWVFLLFCTHTAAVQLRSTTPVAKWHDCGQVVTGLSPWWPEFKSGLLHVPFVVGRVTSGQVLS
jgi:hypothetical protein